MDLDKITEQDELGNYILTEEERLNEIVNLNDSTSIYKVALTLSDINKVNDNILSKIDKYDLKTLLETVDNIECVKKGLPYLSDSFIENIIMQDKYDSKIRFDLLPFLNDEYRLLHVVKTITGDDLLEESLKYFNREDFKKIVIRMIQNIDNKIRLAQDLNNKEYRYEVLSDLPIKEQFKYMNMLDIYESYKLKIILAKDSDYILTEEERLNEIVNLKDDSSLYKVALTLSDTNKVDTRILEKISKYNLRDLLLGIDDIECVKKGLPYLNDSYIETIIMQDKYDSKVRFDLLPFLNDEYSLLHVVKTITGDDLLEESLNYFTKEENKKDVIRMIQNIESKIRLALVLDNKEYRYSVLSDLPIKEQLKYMNILDISDSNKLKIILAKEDDYILTEEERLNEIVNLKDDSSVYKVALTLSDTNKVDTRILEKISKYNLKYLLFDIDDIECVKKGLPYLNDSYIEAIIMQDKYDSKVRFDLLSFFNNEYSLLPVVKTITGDELLEKSLRYFTKEENKKDIIKKIQNIESKIRLALVLDNKAYRYSVLSDLPIKEQFKYMNMLDIFESDKLKIILSKDSDYILTEEERLNEIVNLKDASSIYKVALTLSDVNKLDIHILEKIGNYYLKDLLFGIDNIEYVKKGLPYLTDGYIKDVILQDKYDSRVRFDLLSFIQEGAYKIDIVKTFDDDDLLGESLKYFTSENYKLKIIKMIKNQRTKMLMLQNISNDLYKLEIINTIDEDDILEESLKYFTSYNNKISVVKKIKSAKRIILTKKIIEDIKTIYEMKDAVSKCLTSDQKELYQFIDSILEEENRLINVEDSEIFNDGLRRLNGIGSKYRILNNNSENISDESRILFINDFLNEQDRLDIIRRIKLDSNKIIAYNRNPFNDENNRMRYLRLLKDEGKIEQLYILDNSIDKLIIIKEMNISLRTLALQKVDNYQALFINLFNDGDFKLISDFNDDVLLEIFNNKQIKILHAYNKFSKKEIKEHFAKYIHDYYDKLEENDIDNIATLIFNIDTSNSEEIYKQSDSFVNVLLESDEPLKTFEKIENIFLANHLPSFAKSYLTFLTVHPDFNSYRFDNMNKGSHYVTSPVLNNISLLHKKTLILTDLIKCSLGTNSISLLHYLNNLELWNNVYIDNKEKDYNLLSDYEKDGLKEFRDSILVLYDNYLRKVEIKPSSDIIGDLNKISNILCKKTNNKSLADLIIAGYCHFIGIYSLEDAKKYAQDKLNAANLESIRRYNDNDFKIEQGDFIKGFNINYFYNMIDSGVIAHDYLGADMSTDMTALDTDLSRIWKDTTGMSIKEILDLKDKDSGYFGQGYIVIKDDPNKISLTKKSNNEEYSRIDTVIKSDIFSDKLEAFSNGTSNNISNPYGIRTGFSFDDISFIIFDEEGGTYKENIYKLILPLVMVDRYISIVSKQTGKILFTLDDYNELRDKMSGLKRFSQYEYQFSDKIDQDVFRKITSKIDDSVIYINNIKKEILNTFNEGLGNDYNIITYINGKLNKKEIQVLDSGSTGRATNIPYDGDYDFIIRIDREIDINPELRRDFIKKIISKFDIVKPGRDVDGDIKKMIVRINDREYNLDLSFVRKTDKVSYSTEMCVFDRLDTIYHQDAEKYKLVLANIIYAKMYLKSERFACYSKGADKQGGLGGIGVENWILQNGGSFYDAALDFVSHAYKNDEVIPYEEFIENYRVWDFGENFYTDRDNTKRSVTNNLHDNYISKNLTKQGYEKMCKALKTFIDEYNMNSLDIISEFDIEAENPELKKL